MNANTADSRNPFAQFALFAVEYPDSHHFAGTDISIIASLREYRVRRSADSLVYRAGRSGERDVERRL